ncbi:hypothetical protein HDU98_008103 [Podochytrium sp. JEL0797]|nr:hypothetical protein HDU98_008103 [Podochytrium sp. JEL0797]
MTALVLLVVASLTAAQYVPGGPTQPGLPAGCLGSYPDIQQCDATNWHITTPDPCKPSSVPMPGQQVYIHDQNNFCINLPNPNSILMQQMYYNQGVFPTVVQAEGYVQSFCVGSYLPPGALPMAPNAIQSAHVKQVVDPVYGLYYQVHGTMDCGALNINCESSSPGAYDDGGQYDNGPYVSCGKEPYSGVDASAYGNQNFQDYVEMAGDGIFCMRVCQAGAMTVGGPCDVTHDTAGCQAFMKVDFTPGFTFTDSNGVVTTSGSSNPNPPVPTAAPGGVKIADWATCGPSVGSSVCASSGFICCIASADLGSQKSTCRPNDSQNCAAPAGPGSVPTAAPTTAPAPPPVPTAAPGGAKIADWATCGPNVGSSVCASSGFICCIASADLGSQKSTCRPNDSQNCAAPAGSGPAPPTPTAAPPAPGGAPIADWMTCGPSVGSSVCATAGNVCCVAPGDAGSGKMTCRPNNLANCIAVVGPPSTGPPSAAAIEDWATCGSSVGSSVCASSGFVCCIASADLGSRKSTCRPDNSQECAAPAS